MYAKYSMAPLQQQVVVPGFVFAFTDLTLAVVDVLPVETISAVDLGYVFLNVLWWCCRASWWQWSFLRRRKSSPLPSSKASLETTAIS